MWLKNDNNDLYINHKIGINTNQPKAELHINHNSIFKQIRCVAPKYFKKIYESIKAKEVYEIKISTLQEQKPEKQNSINLSNNFDPLKIPLSKIYWRRSPSEIKSARLIAEELGKVFIDNEIGRIALKEYLFKHFELLLNRYSNLIIR